MLQGYCCYSSTPPLIVESIIKGRRNKGLAIIIANWHNDCVFYRYGSISSDILNEAIMDKFSADKVGCFQPSDMLMLAIILETMETLGQSKADSYT